MIFDILAALADRGNDGKDNFNSTPAQAKDTLIDVTNITTPKEVIQFATVSGDSQIINETLTVGDRTVVNNQLDDLKHVIVGMQQKQPLKVIQDNQASSSSSSSSSSGAPLVGPLMVLTITGLTGDVTWCGETWSLPSESGVTKTVAATDYDKSKAVVTDNSPSYGVQRKSKAYKHSWKWSDGVHSTGLALYRKWAMSSNQDAPWSLTGTTTGPLVGSYVAVYPGPKNYTYPTYFGNGNAEWLGVNYIFDYRNWRNFATAGTLSNYVAGQVNGTPYYNMGILSLSEPTKSDYTLDGRFFSSYTSAGVTYTWQKGTGW